MNRELNLIAVLAACALAAIAAPAASQQPAGQPPLGRLFFTPAQRASLDVARTQRARTALSTERAEEQAAPAAQTLTYGGMVRRSDGKTTVWINNRPVNDNEAAAGATVVGRVRADGSVSLQMPQSGRTIELKPGQSIELLSGAIEEGFTRKPVQPEPKPVAGATSPAKPAPSENARADRERVDRDREEREQQRVEEAVTRAIQGTSGSKSNVPSSAEKPKEPAP